MHWSSHCLWMFVSVSPPSMIFLLSNPMTSALKTWSYYSTSDASLLPKGQTSVLFGWHCEHPRALVLQSGLTAISTALVTESYCTNYTSHTVCRLHARFPRHSICSPTIVHALQTAWNACLSFLSTTPNPISSSCPSAMSFVLSSFLTFGKNFSSLLASSWLHLLYFAWKYIYSLIYYLTHYAPYEVRICHLITQHSASYVLSSRGIVPYTMQMLNSHLFEFISSSVIYIQRPREKQSDKSKGANK